VHALITRDKLVGEGKTGHEATLLQPEDRSERAREEDALDGGKGDEAAGEGGLLVADPSQGPVSLLTDAGNVVNGVEEVLALADVADVGVDKKGVGLGVDVLHHDLEAVEATSLRDLHLGAETLDQVLVDNAIRSGEESEHV